MDRETRLAVFRMLNEYAVMQGLDLRDKHNTCITDDIWDFGFYYENEAVNPWFSFNWLNITDSQFSIVYQVIRVFEENARIANCLKYKHNLKKNCRRRQRLYYSKGENYYDELFFAGAAEGRAVRYRTYREDEAGGTGSQW